MDNSLNILSPGDEVIFKYKSDILHGVVNVVNDLTYDIICVSCVNNLVGKVLEIKDKNITHKHISSHAARKLNSACGLNLDLEYVDFCNRFNSDYMDTTYTAMFGSDYSSILCAFKYQNIVVDIVNMNAFYIQSISNLLTTGVGKSKLDSALTTIMSDAMIELMFSSKEDSICRHTFNEMLRSIFCIYNKMEDNKEALKSMAHTLKFQLSNEDIVKLVKYLEGS